MRTIKYTKLVKKSIISDKKVLNNCNEKAITLIIHHYYAENKLPPQDE
jgi:hypothetical protein